jgi:hypothetical protein
MKGHLERMGKMRNTYRIVLEKPEGKTTLKTLAWVE